MSQVLNVDCLLFSYINERNRKKNIIEAEKAIVVSFSECGNGYF